MADLPVMPDTVPLKACGCGAIEGDACDCAEFFAEMVAAMAEPIWWQVTR